jgi:hypothetical protein
VAVDLRSFFDPLGSCLKQPSFELKLYIAWRARHPFLRPFRAAATALAYGQFGLFEFNRDAQAGLRAQLRAVPIRCSAACRASQSYS